LLIVVDLNHPDGRAEVYYNIRQIDQRHLEAPQHG
jgi:hypothetical protein